MYVLARLEITRLTRATRDDDTSRGEPLCRGAKWCVLVIRIGNHNLAHIGSSLQHLSIEILSSISSVAANSTSESRNLSYSAPSVCRRACGTHAVTKRSSKLERHSIQFIEMRFKFSHLNDPTVHSGSIGEYCSCCSLRFTWRVLPGE